MLTHIPPSTSLANWACSAWRRPVGILGAIISKWRLCRDRFIEDRRASAHLLLFIEFNPSPAIFEGRAEPV